VPVSPFFIDFKKEIDASFERAKSDAGVEAKDVRLELTEDPWASGIVRAEFMVLPSLKLVRITWAGIASLWACSQGMARISRRAFDGSRKKTADKLVIEKGSQLEAGCFLLELSKGLCSQDLREDDQGKLRWPEWAPLPNASPKGEDDVAGNSFFYGALAWIMRHELAHVVLDHENREKIERKSWPEYEQEADIQATTWLRGERAVDQDRQLGTRPTQEELDLEIRGVAIGIAVIWIASFESHFGRTSKKHPPAAERLFNSFDCLGLREDSFACEVIALSIHAWLDPQGSWSSREKPFPTARDFLTEAIVRLHRYMGDLA